MNYRDPLSRELFDGLSAFTAPADGGQSQGGCGLVAYPA